MVNSMLAWAMNTLFQNTRGRGLEEGKGEKENPWTFISQQHSRGPEGHSLHTADTFILTATSDSTDVSSLTVLDAINLIDESFVRELGGERREEIHVPVKQQEVIKHGEH